MNQKTSNDNANIPFGSVEIQTLQSPSFKRKRAFWSCGRAYRCRCWGSNIADMEHFHPSLEPGFFPSFFPHSVWSDFFSVNLNWKYVNGCWLFIQRLPRFPRFFPVFDKLEYPLFHWLVNGCYQPGVWLVGSLWWLTCVKVGGWTLPGLGTWGFKEPGEEGQHLPSPFLHHKFSRN